MPSRQSSKPRNTGWDSTPAENDFQRYLRAKGKTLEELEYEVEESRAIHELESYNAPKSASDSGILTPPDGWVVPKFEGGSSKWLRLTAQDRAIVTSLARLANEDLSVHLYNAHVLKGQANASKHVDGKGGQANVVWPPRSWTKWPMKPEDVPRCQFKQISERDVNEDVWRSMRDSRGSTEDLREAIVATFLKQARERFIRRDTGLDLSGTHSHEEEDASMGSDSSSSLGAASPSSQVSSKKQSEKEEPRFDDLGSPKRKRRTSSSAGASMDTSPPDQKPVPMADDDKATALLAPIARHMLSNIDKLLAGLHHQRQAYITTTMIDSDITADDANADDGSSDVSSASIPMSPSKRPRGDSLSVPQSPAKRLKSTWRHSASHRSSRNQSQSSVRSSRSTESQRRRTTRLIPRDWSDVFGVAILSGGFQQEVVERAAARCASLFGEGVSFRTLGNERSGEGDREFDILPSGYYEKAPRKRPGKVHGIQNLVRVKSRGLFCQVKWCKRHRQGFSRPWNLNKHMKEIHGIPTPKDSKLASRREPSELAAKGVEDTFLDGYEAGESDDQIEEGVHVDGYLQEIGARPYYSRYWSRPHLKRGREKRRRKSRGDESELNRGRASSRESMRARGEKNQTDGAAETESIHEESPEQYGKKAADNWIENSGGSE